MLRAPFTNLALALLMGASACGGGDTDPGDAACPDGKCDVPDDEEPAALCELRRADAFNENQLAFTAEALRWSCNDAAGVTGPDRGQEYCEYFAIAALPPAEPDAEAPPPAVLGRNLGADSSYGTTETALELSYQQIQTLEEDESAVAGQCVFTSWNSDVPGPVPACESGACPEVLGVPVDEDTFRMKFEVNSAEAAQVLVEDCLAWPDSEEADDFTRGCLMNADINETEFRKSDSTICAASMRLAECECWPAEGEADFPVLISPAERRGFPLGTWSDAAELPAGCRHVELGDDSRTVVTCDLTAADLLNYSLDLKARCQSKYADNVVVHVPLPPPAAVECTPERSDSPHAGTCGATPWILEP